MSPIEFEIDVINPSRCVDSLQDTFEKLTYEVIGDDSAPRYFRIEPRSGLLIIASDLSKDSRMDYTVGGLIT